MTMFLISCYILNHHYCGSYYLFKAIGEITFCRVLFKPQVACYNFKHLIKFWGLVGIIKYSTIGNLYEVKTKMFVNN